MTSSVAPYVLLVLILAAFILADRWRRANRSNDPDRRGIDGTGAGAPGSGDVWTGGDTGCSFGGGDSCGGGGGGGE